MEIYRLVLKDFRNYTERSFSFSSGTNLVLGNNAVGKTNLLEAINLLSVGESFRARRVDEMVRFEAEFGRVSGSIEDGEEKIDLEVMVSRGVVGGKAVAKRRFLVDGAPKRKPDFLGILLAVVFRPEDLELLDGSPSIRRTFLDHVLVKVDPIYERDLTVYEQALRRRNRLLDAIRDGSAKRYALTFWDGLLIKHGSDLQERRLRFVEFVNDLWGKSELFNKLKFEYDRSVVSESRLEQYKNEEVAVGYTLVGPHKDDVWVVGEGKRRLETYGSRGEKRMAVLALKMGEIYFLESVRNKRPILLLDDIFSELDDNHREEVLRVMKGRQVIVSSADEKEVERLVEATVIEMV